MIGNGNGNGRLKKKKYMNAEEASVLMGKAENSAKGGGRRAVIRWMLIDLVMECGMRVGEISGCTENELRSRWERFVDVKKEDRPKSPPLTKKNFDAFIKEQLRLKPGIKHRDIDLKGKRLTVMLSKRRGEVSNEIILSPELVTHIKEFTKWKKKEGLPCGGEDHLLSSGRGRLGRGALQQMFRVAVKKAFGEERLGRVVFEECKDGKYVEVKKKNGKKGEDEKPEYRQLKEGERVKGKRFKRTIERQTSIHNARHSAAVIRLQNDKSALKLVQEQLGHASILTTANIYAHTTDEEFAESANGFRESIRGKK